MKLLSEAELAEDFGLDEEKVAKLRRKHRWPHVRLSRFEVRYTEEQVRQIVDSQTTRPAPAAPAGPTSPVAGQSAKSAARRRK